MVGRILRTRDFMPIRGARGLVLLLALSLAVGCASATSGGEPVRPASPDSEAADPGSALSTAEIEAIYRARTERARTRFTEADGRFMTGMIHHHAQAIEMSRLAPARAAAQSIHTLAARIINAQQDEIATMQQWLRDRDLPVPEVHVTGAAVRVHGADHPRMPGMVTREQIESLAAADGPAFDRLFLPLMIEHHNGAVTMVSDLFATDGAGQDEEVFRFASDVQVDQLTEVARMERMLAAFPPEGDFSPPGHTLKR
jgi:uncharacterized protein (DUF305 family)